MSDFFPFPLCSLTKDMTGKEEEYRASAIRALCTILDVSRLILFTDDVIVIASDSAPFSRRR